MREEKYELTLIKQPEGKGRYLIGGRQGYDLVHEDKLNPSTRLRLITAGLQTARQYANSEKEFPEKIRARIRPSDNSVEVELH